MARPPPCCKGWGGSSKAVAETPSRKSNLRKDKTPKTRNATIKHNEGNLQIGVGAAAVPAAVAIRVSDGRATAAAAATEKTVCVYNCKCIYIYIYIYTHTHITELAEREQSGSYCIERETRPPARHASGTPQKPWKPLVFKMPKTKPALPAGLLQEDFI